MRNSTGLYYMHGDQLGSTSVVVNNSGVLVSRQTYYPFGMPRTSEGTALTSLTDFTFTGQKVDTSTGLMFYGARYYDAELGRFTQADTIVPNNADPQSLNRFSYVLNNPIRYTDPTGHQEGECDHETDACDDYYNAQGLCWSDSKQAYKRECDPTADNPDVIEEIYGVDVDGNWAGAELNTLVRALYEVVKAFNEATGYGQSSFRKIWGGVSILRCHDADLGCQGDAAAQNGWTADYGNGVIRMFDRAFTNPLHSATEYVLHELGHVWDETVNSKLSAGMAQFVGASQKGCDSIAFLGCVWRVAPPRYSGGLYGRPPNPVEDWTDSFMTYVRDFDAGTVDYSNLRNIYVAAEIIGGGVGQNSCSEGFVYLEPWRCP